MSGCFFWGGGDNNFSIEYSNFRNKFYRNNPARLAYFETLVFCFVFFYEITLRVWRTQFYRSIWRYWFRSKKKKKTYLYNDDTRVFFNDPSGYIWFKRSRYKRELPTTDGCWSVWEKKIDISKGRSIPSLKWRLLDNVTQNYSVCPIWSRLINIKRHCILMSWCFLCVFFFSFVKVQIYIVRQ